VGTTGSAGCQSSAAELVTSNPGCATHETRIPRRVPMPKTPYGGDGQRPFPSAAPLPLECSASGRHHGASAAEIKIARMDRR
jgi:hypothetical protein